MSKLVIIEKSGSSKSVIYDPKNITSIEEFLCKKCGFKTLTDFKCVNSWTTTFNNINYELKVFGKTKGKAGSENKYEFPPPIDNTLLFGNCIAVLYNEQNEIISMSEDEFNDIMEFLYGGFEDIGSSDSETESETESEEMDKPLTKQGYVKDDFVVSDDEEMDEKPKKKAAVAKKPVIKKKPAKPEPVVVDTVLTISDELGEEEYL